MGTNACSCPRCGYDLSGVISSWHECCPVDGTCSECGLGLRWAEVLNPLLTVPTWSFEHAWRWRTLALVRTLLLAVCPWRMWRGLRMEHPVRLARIPLVALAGVCAAWIAAGAIIIAFGLIVPLLIRLSLPSADEVGEVLHFALWPYGPDRFVMGSRGWTRTIEPWVLVLMVWWCLFPFGLLTLPVTLRRAKVRPRHLVRVWGYSLASLPLALLVWLMPPAVETVSWALFQSSTQQSSKLWQTAAWVSAQAQEWRWTVFVVLVPLWGLLLWRSAIHRYLRLPHAEGIVLAAGVIVAGGVLLGALFVPGLMTALLFDL